MERLRAVLVGCGNMSRAWLRAAGDIADLEVVGLVDIDESTARLRAAEFGLDHAAVGTDLALVLGTTTPDLVFDVAVPEAHVEVTLTALRHGCHVLGEKPLADTLDNARRLVAAAEDAGRLFAVIQNRRYQREVRRVRRFLASGVLGPLTTVNSDFYIGAHFGGFRDRMAHVLLLDMAIHTFDAARFLTGADPVSVYCKEWNPPGSWYDRDAAAIAIFEMSGGLVYTYRGSWCAEGVNTAWEGDWRFIGRRGGATWDGGDGFKAETVEKTEGLRSSNTRQELPPHDPADDDKTAGHASLIREFVTCVRTGAEPDTSAANNIKSLAMVFAAIESARSGREAPVRW